MSCYQEGDTASLSTAVRAEPPFLAHMRVLKEQLEVAQRELEWQYWDVLIDSLRLYCELRRHERLER